MAIMIPEMPRDYDPVSLEGAMFDALKKLPEDYYICLLYTSDAADD